GEKPEKPYPGFPLYAHASGRWAKKILGRIHYFGPWRDWQTALAKYQEQRDDLHAGRTPRDLIEKGITIKDAVNHFLTTQRDKLAAKEIVKSTYDDYFETCTRIVNHFGR